MVIAILKADLAMDEPHLVGSTVKCILAHSASVARRMIAKSGGNISDFEIYQINGYKNEINK